MSKCLIATGGGRGIGAEVSRKAAKQGYSVCVNFHRDQTSAQKLVRELEKDGANALADKADVSQEEEDPSSTFPRERQSTVPLGSMWTTPHQKPPLTP